MNTYIALLRGINVSGKNTIKMEALKQLFLTLGHTQVSTYIQSGNVLFTSLSEDAEMLSTNITAAIQKEFGYEVPVLVITKEHLKSLAASNPFLKREEVSVDELHVTFLKEAASKEGIEKCKLFAAGTDEFREGEKALYIRCSHGYGNTKLTNTLFESKLKVPCTTRNWKTVMKLLELSGA